MLYSFINKLTDKGQQHCLPTNANDHTVAHNFSQFYKEKVVKIRNGIDNHPSIFSCEFDWSSDEGYANSSSDQCLSVFSPY